MRIRVCVVGVALARAGQTLVVLMLSNPIEAVEGWKNQWPHADNSVRYVKSVSEAVVRP